LQSRGVGKAPNSETSANSVNSATRKIWHTNRMDTRAGEVHKEALKNGDAYIIVWPNARGEAVFYPNRAANISETAKAQMTAGRWDAQVIIDGPGDARPPVAPQPRKRSEARRR